MCERLEIGFVELNVFILLPIVLTETTRFINIFNSKKAHLNFLKALARVNFSLQVDALAF